MLGVFIGPPAEEHAPECSRTDFDPLYWTAEAERHHARRPPIDVLVDRHHTGEPEERFI